MAKRDILNDLQLTAMELNNAYEEISLLYRLSDMFSARNVAEICDNLVTEAAGSMRVKTAAVLFLNEKNHSLFTKACSGSWDKHRTINARIGVIRNALDSGNPTLFSKLDKIDHCNSLNGLKSVLLSPLKGKDKTIGLLVLADKNSFYPNELKLVRFITTQAALAIENTFLYKEIEDLLIGTIQSLVKALEATAHWTAGHTERVTEYCHGIAKEMGLDMKHIERLKICSLLHDIGKIAIPRDILNKQGQLELEEWNEMKRHPVLGVKILSGLSELKNFDDILDGIKYHHEHWDGSKGLFDLKGSAIPLMSRILAVADSFDAMTSDRPYRPRKSVDSTITEIRSLSNKQFDPAVVDAFLRWFSRQHQASLS